MNVFGANQIPVYLPDVIGKGYGTFWRDKARYRILKGGRGSKKSTTTALNIIYRMMKYPLANTLIVRRYANTHANSTFAQLHWAIKRLKVEHLWHVNVKSMSMYIKATGQTILFRGFDDPDSITSITVSTGVLCWVWIEEAFQISNEESFNKLDMSIRGEMPPGLFKQITLTFNPWSDKIWIKKRFCDKKSPLWNVYTTNYMCNEWLDDQDRMLFEDLKKNNPRRYRIEGLGEWGIAQGLIYENWQEQEFDIDEDVYKKGIYAYSEYGELKFRPYYFGKFGMDFGYTNDPTAFVACAVSIVDKKIYIYDEVYKPRLSNQDIVNEITYKGFRGERIICDSEDPRTINELKKMGLSRAVGAKKGKGSVLAGIQKLQDFQIIVHPRCSNFLVEISNYVWDTNKEGVQINKPIDDYNHLMDALRYATEDITTETFTFAS